LGSPSSWFSSALASNASQTLDTLRNAISQASSSIGTRNSSAQAQQNQPQQNSSRQDQNQQSQSRPNQQ
jgi:hypothetical protein